MDEAARARDSVLALLEATMEADEDTKVLLQEAANASQDHTDLLQAINASLLQLVQVGLYSIIPNLVAIASMDRSPFRMCSCQTSRTVVDDVHGETEPTLTSQQQQAAVLQGVKKHVIIRQ